MIGVKEKIKEVKSKLSEELKIKDFGDVSVILSIQVEQNDDFVMLSQEHYIDKVLTQFRMNEFVKSTDLILPSETTKRVLAKEDDAPFNDAIYRSAVGSILYVANNTRPDLAFTASYLSRKNSNPTVKDWKLVKCVLRYLFSTKDVKLCYKKGDATMDFFL